MSRFRISLITACAVAAAVPAGADAAVSCTYDAGAKQVDVTLTANENYAPIQRDVDAQIRVNGAVCLDGMVKATVNNTDRIVATDVSGGGGTTVGIIPWNGAFGPGATDEGDGDSEIEVEFDGGGGFDTLQIVGGSQPDKWRAGAVPGGTGVNVNAASEPGAGADVDVKATLVEKLSLSGADGDDDVSGGGGFPFGGPVAIPMGVLGGDHDDIVRGGAAGDTLEGWTGNDELHGGGGNDELRGQTGSDELDGDAGLDLAEYQHATGGVTVDLRLAGLQDTGGDGVDSLTEVEDLAGSAHADTLVGDGAHNRFRGRGGDDRLAGNGGNDLLDGEGAVDTVSYAAAPAGVEVTLGFPGAQDTVGAGTDTIVDVENVTGSGFADTLAGDEGPNVLEGGAGGDGLAGNGGPDTLRVRDGEGDEAGCGAGIDGVVTDEPGRDALVACENVDALPAPADPPAEPNPNPSPNPGPQPGADPGTTPSGGPSGETSPLGDRAAPALTAVRRRGGRIVFRSSERARVSLLIVRDRGRRSRPRFRTVRSLARTAVAGRNRVRLPRGLKAGRYRAVLVATDAAGNRSRKVFVAFRVTRR